MNSAYIIGSLVFGGWVIYTTYAGNNHATNNITRLIWMKNHIYEHPKSKDEEESIEKSLNEQNKYKKNIIHVFFPPNVPWTDLPMDREYAKEFHN